MAHQIEKHQEQFDLLKHQLQAKMQQAERATFTNGVHAVVFSD